MSGYEMVQTSSTSVANGAFASITAACSSGKKVVGAAAYWLSSDQAVQFFPSGGSSPNLWTASGINPGSTDKIFFRIICLTV